MSGNKQSRTPILNAVQDYISTEPAYFRIPAHRFSRGVSEHLKALLGEQVFCADLTEAEGLDDLHAASGAIAEAEQLAAELWGSEQCYYLVNGSTCGNEAMLLTCLKPGDKVLLARNVHKSVLMGLILSGAVPVWMQPEIFCEGELDGPVTADTVAGALQKDPDCRAVMVVSPTYYGICSPLKEIADVCHKKGIPLLVDEAHGSHLYFLDGAPCGAVSAGADLVVQSIHKTGGSMTQSSLLHVQGDRIDRTRLRESLAMVMSTSPSYVLMASLDGARNQLAMCGRELMRQACLLADQCRERLAKIPGVDVPEVTYRDPLRVVFTAKKLGITGSELQDALFCESKISLELSDPVFAVAVITWGNTQEDIDRLIEAVSLAAGRGRRHSAETIPQRDPAAVFHIRPVTVCSPRNTWYAEKESIPLEKSGGETAAESVIPYPPGIPVLYPGEKITEEVLKQLMMLRESHTPLHGPEDTTLRTIRIMKRNTRYPVNDSVG